MSRSLRPEGLVMREHYRVEPRTRWYHVAMVFIAFAFIGVLLALRG